MKTSLTLLLSVLVLMCSPKDSLAHSVYIFAWADGPQICTESYFTQKSKVRGGEVRMLDASGNVLASGLTGEDGLYCFSLPEKVQPLVFSVQAGPGHKGSFTLEESEVAEAVTASKGSLHSQTTPPHPEDTVETKAPSPLKANPAEPSQLNESQLVVNQSGLNQPDDSQTETAQRETRQTHTSRQAKVNQQTSIHRTTLQRLPEGQENEVPSIESIRAIVREELQQQLSPMRHYLAEKLENTTPGPREIIGGIGWLVGIGALGFWASQRKRR